jgi:hypothetical protein
MAFGANPQSLLVDEPEAGDAEGDAGDIHE